MSDDLTRGEFQRIMWGEVSEDAEVELLRTVVDRLQQERSELEAKNVDYIIDLKRLRQALEQDASVMEQAQAIMRKEGFRFETRLDLSEGFEKLAFTFYTLLASVDANARAALGVEA